MKKSDGKLRLLAVERMFQRRVPLTARTIIRRLKKEYGIEADRKTIYDDIYALTRFMPIELFGSGRNTYWKLLDMNNPKEWEGVKQ